MAEVHLGATHFFPGTTTNHESIHAARNCLEAVSIEDLPVRYQSHFYIAKSDLHRCTNEKTEAEWWAKKALKVAKKNDFRNEIRSAEARLNFPAVVSP